MGGSWCEICGCLLPTDLGSARSRTQLGLTRWGDLSRGDIVVLLWCYLCLCAGTEYYLRMKPVRFSRAQVMQRWGCWSVLFTTLGNAGWLSRPRCKAVFPGFTDNRNVTKWAITPASDLGKPNDGSTGAPHLPSCSAQTRNRQEQGLQSTTLLPVSRPLKLRHMKTAAVAGRCEPSTTFVGYIFKYLHPV